MQDRLFRQTKHQVPVLTDCKKLVHVGHPRSVPGTKGTVTIWPAYRRQHAFMSLDGYLDKSGTKRALTLRAGSNLRAIVESARRVVSWARFYMALLDVITNKHDEAWSGARHGTWSCTRALNIVKFQ